MKTKMILITVIALCLLVGGMGCKDEPNVIDIYHTWKFQGFGNVTDSSFEKVKLDCLIDSCFILIFSKNGNFSGNTSSNGISGSYAVEGKKITISNLFGTKRGEMGSGYKYSDALRLIESYEIYQNKLKLYYNQGQNYLLFNLLNK